MSLVKYRAFISAVGQGSLTKAAKVMGYSQPGISKMIDSLEEELNISLYVRNRSSIELTDNGKLVYIYCREIIKHDDELITATNAMNGLLTGNIRIGALNSIILEYVPRIIRMYSSAYPNIRISLDELSFAGIVESLKNNTIDIGFSSEFNINGIDFYPLFKDPCRLIVNKEHPFALLDKIPISTLNGCDLIIIPSYGDDVLNAVKKTKQFAPVAKYYIHSDSAAVSMVGAGLGAYIISEMQCNRLPDNVVKKEFEENVFRVMGIGIKSSKKTTPALKELIKILKSTIEKEKTK